MVDSYRNTKMMMQKHKLHKEDWTGPRLNYLNLPVKLCPAWYLSYPVKGKQQHANLTSKNPTNLKPFKKHIYRYGCRT